MMVLWTQLKTMRVVGSHSVFTDNQERSENDLVEQEIGKKTERKR